MTRFAFMTNQEELVRHLKQNVRVLSNPRLAEAFRAVDRALFAPEKFQDEAYEDYPLPIGFGATISQPTTVAFMLEKLDVLPSQKVLDIGSGSGWTTALLAHLVGEKGKVIGIEIVPELVSFGQKNLEKYHSYVRRNVGMTPSRGSQERGRAQIRQAKKGVAGLPEESPYDRILVSAATPKIPRELIEQLNPGGVMVIPVGRDGAIQSLLKIKKQADGSLEFEEYPGFAFVPLVE